MEVKKVRVEPVGLGDVLEEIFQKTGIAVVFTKVTGIPSGECTGCNNRKALLNKIPVYKKK